MSSEGVGGATLPQASSAESKTTSGSGVTKHRSYGFDASKLVTYPKVLRQTGGVLPMSIIGRMKLEQDRLAGMNEVERAWRAQWLKDQELSHREPVFVPEYFAALNNPFRRNMKLPLDFFFKRVIEPIAGAPKAYFFRHLIGKGLVALGVMYVVYYEVKYNGKTFEQRAGQNMRWSPEAVLPGDPDFPFIYKPNFDRLNNGGFKMYIDRHPDDWKRSPTD
ncbi:unnamed protein product [Cyprideis torosa]|uniref:NADH dehydrogenase [ubiquinone] 1 beta subcomplex subunit 6 n=1 Tax=Cyprideis torosa TaxID=163714 RepID=A0A7R8W6F9_9CRUS|nr:unnamed protein product [Cyprideis torosa]CAG0884032.1 unnamed protein product [Cyprideis torosa]